MRELQSVGNHSATNCKEAPHKSTLNIASGFAAKLVLFYKKVISIESLNR